MISVSEDIAVKDENDQMIVSTIEPLNKEEITIAYIGNEHGRIKLDSSKKKINNKLNNASKTGF